MNRGIESVSAVRAAQAGAPAFDGVQTPVPQTAATPDTFATVMQRELGELNASLGAAESAMRDLAGGKSVELHEVMISLERARISVQTFVQIRNKLVESYQDLMRMQL